MGRKSTKETRLDGMSQRGRRRYLKKVSPQGRKDAKDWTVNVMQKLEAEKEELVNE